MEANSVPLHALFRTEHGEEARPVVAWDAGGNALTVDWKAGTLCQAATQEGFLYLDDDSVRHAEVRGVLPAPPGWHLVTQEEGRRIVQPIIGWSVNGFGCGNPLVVDARGDLIVASTQNATAYAPGDLPGD